MTFLSITHRPARSILDGAVHAATDAIHAVARAWSFRRAARALSLMDDAMLRDIGVARGDIETAVRHGRSSLSR